MRKLILTIGLAASAQAAPWRDYKLVEREPIHHTFQAARTLDVDEIAGFIHVIGDSGNTIRVEGERVTRALDQAGLQRAKSEVVLDRNEKDGVAQLYENGPFRGQHYGFHEHGDRDYEVSFNLTIHVPAAAGLRLRTINGEIKADDTSGNFDIHGLNGAIAMTGIAGSGSVETLNGAAVVTFRENPKAASSFKSFNGKVDVTFPAGLSADIRLKTFNGSAFTDFDMTALAGGPGLAERRDGKFRYKSNEFRALRVGLGGPELKFETFNGDIRIQRKK